MSSKFFTWTKGDRNVETGALALQGIVPIPAECISINGYEYGQNPKRTHKQRRGPLHIDTDDGLSPGSGWSHRTKSSFALQDAAVKSATCLMAAVTDMLRTPQLSAHLSAQQHHQGLFTPASSRPRSRTAPPTPMVAASQPEVAELPGDVYLDQHTPLATRGTLDKILAYPKQSNLTTDTNDVSPWTVSSTPFDAEPASTKHPSSTTSLCPPYSSRSRSYSESQYSSSEKEVLLSAHDDTQTAWTRRPALKALRNDTWTEVKTPERPTPIAQRRSTQWSATADVQFPPYPLDARERGDDVALVDQIISMRVSHEAQINSLRAAHDRELESHRTYIRALEFSRARDMPDTPMSKQSLTIDTSRPKPPFADPLSSIESATTLVSLDNVPECQKRKSQGSASEVDDLKRQLSGARRVNSEAESVVRERDGLLENVERQGQELAQVNDVMQGMKRNEEALRNALADFKSRLEVANAERVDALEGFHLATKEVDVLRGREFSAKREIETLRQQLSETRAEENDARSRHHSLGGDAIKPVPLNLGPHKDELVDGLNRKIKDQDLRIKELETAAKSVEYAETLIVKVDELENSLSVCQKQLAATHADRQRYYQLYHEELHRKSPNQHRPESNDGSLRDTVQPTINTCQNRTVGHRHSAVALSQLSRGPGQSKPLIVADYRHSNNHGENQSRNDDQIRRRPITSHLTPHANLGVSQDTKVRRASVNGAHPQASGLGITGVALSQPVSGRQHNATYPPPASPGRAHILGRSPSSMPTSISEKALPNPPVELTSSPTQTRAIERGESMRSTSDSIISSYAKLPSYNPRWATTPPTSKFYQPPAHQLVRHSLRGAGHAQTHSPSVPRSTYNIQNN